MLALPQGGAVIAGGASIGNPQNSILQINQSTQRAIINWNSFSIGNGETVNFNQPSTSASMLNRVTGGNLSSIYGNLNADGNIYLINPNGVLIGSSGVLNVNSFIASTLNVSNSAFMGGGDLIFKGDSTAEVKNLGEINALEGDVFLIGRKVVNAGTINAPKGTVGFAAGEPADGENLEVLLKSSGSERIFIRVKKKVVTDDDESANADSKEGDNTNSNEGNGTTSTTSPDPDATTTPDETVNTSGDGSGGSSSTSTNGVSGATANDSPTDPEPVASGTTTSGGSSTTGGSGSSTTVSSSDTTSNDTAGSDSSDSNSTTVSGDTTTTEIDPVDPVTVSIDGDAFEAGTAEEVIPEFEYVWEAVDTQSNVGQIVGEAVNAELDAVETEETSSGSGSGLVEVKEASILNTGVINAVQAELKAVGGNQYALAINNTGEIRATGVEVDESGTVSLVAKSGDIENSGTISAQNANGDGGNISVQAETGRATNAGTIDVSSTVVDGKAGYVEVLGEEVQLLNNSLINASGNAKGGEVLVGGDKLGLNPEIQNAVNTIMEELAVIRADALVAGDGGKAIVYADNFTDLQGTITARGGLEAGNGGFIETSGKNSIQLNPTLVPDASARAEGYIGGEWLIDPNNISIVTGSGNTNINTGTPFATTNDSSVLGVDLIATALTGGTSVTLTTGSAGINSEDGNITWGSGVTLDYDGKGAASLTLDAANNILFDGTIHDSSVGGDSLNVTFNADSDNNNSGSVVLSGGSIATNGGTITMQGSSGVTLGSSSNLNSAGGNIILQTKNNGSGVGNFTGVLIDTSNVDSGAGTLTLNGHGGSTSSSNVGVKVAGSSNISATGAISIYGTGATGNNSMGVYFENGATISGSGGITINGTGGLGTDSHGVQIGNASISATGSNIDITGSSSTKHGVFLDTASGSSSVSASGSGNVTVTGGSTAGTGSFGVYVGQNSTISATGTGNVSLVQSASGNSDGIKIASNASGVSVGSGTLNLISNAATIINDGNSSNFLISTSASGNFIAKARDVATAMNLGVGASDIGLQLNSSELGEIGPFGSLTFGRSDGSGNITVNDVDLLSDVTLENSLGTITVSGNVNTHASAVGDKSLTVNAGSGNVTLSGTVGGTKTLNNLSITTSGSISASSNVSTSGTQLYDTGTGLNFSGTTFTGSAVTVQGAGALTINSNTTIDTSAANGNITLNSAADSGGSAFDLTLNMGTGTLTTGSTLGNSMGFNNLTINGGAISDGGQVWKGSNLVVNVGSSNDITMNGASHDFNSVNLTGNNISYRDATGVQLNGITATGTLDVSTDTGDITQAASSTISVAGNTSLTATSGNIDLKSASGISNAFNTLTVSSSGYTKILETDAVELSSVSNVMGNLELTTGGAITQTGAISVGGTATIDSGGSAVTLNHASNDFSTIYVTNAGAIDIADTNALNTSTITSSSSVTISAGGALDVQGDITAGGGGDITVVSDSMSIMGGTFSGSGALNLKPFTTSANFTSPAGLSSAVSGSSFTAINIGRSDMISGFVTFTGENFTGNHTGAINVYGGASSATLSGSINGAIDLRMDASLIGLSGNIGNVNALNSVLFNGDVSLGLNTNISVSGGGDISFNNNVNGAHALTLNNSSGNVYLNGTVGDTTALNSLSITSGGNITQQGGWSISGNTSLNAGSNNIDLTGYTNAFAGDIELNANGDVQLDNSIATSLGASTIGGSLNILSTGGSISQTGALDITGFSDFAAHDATTATYYDISLTNNSNIFTGSVGLFGDNIYIHSSTDLIFDQVDAYTSLSVDTSSAGNTASVLQTGSPFTVYGPLSISSGADIDLTGPYNNINDGITEGGSISAIGTNFGIDLVPDPTAPPPTDEGEDPLDDPIFDDDDPIFDEPIFNISDPNDPNFIPPDEIFDFRDDPIAPTTSPNFEIDESASLEPIDDTLGEGEGDLEGEGPGEGEPGPGEDEGPVDEEGEPGSEEEGRPVEDEAPAPIEEGPINGADTSFDDAVLAPGETFSPGGNVGPPPPNLNTATAPVVRVGLGDTNANVENVPPPPATPIPSPVPPAPPALDVFRALPGPALGMNFGGPPITPPPQVQATLNLSTGPAVMNSLSSLPGFE